MRKKIPFAKLLFPILFICLQASGQEKVLMANCQMGQGCHFQLTNTTPSEADLVLGTGNMVQNAPPGSILVSARVNGKTSFYMESEKNRTQLDQFYGGDGFTQIYLFAPGIQPADGKWTIQVNDAEGSACIVDALPMIQKSLKGYSQSGAIAFRKPFNPRQLLDNPNVKWLGNDLNQYTAILDFGVSAGKDFMKMIYNVKVINDERIEAVMNVRVRVPIPGEKDCTYRIPITYQCTARRKPKVDYLPDDKPKAKVDYLPDDKPKAKVDYLPEDKPKAKVELLPDHEPKKQDKKP